MVFKNLDKLDFVDTCPECQCTILLCKESKTIIFCKDHSKELITYEVL